MGKILRVGILISGKISASVKASANKAVKSQTRVGTAIRKVNNQFAQAKSARKYGKLLGQLKKKQRALGHSSDSLDKGIADVERRYHQARRAASRYGAEVGDVTRKQRRLNSVAGKGRLGRGATGAAVATAGAAALGLSVRKAMIAQEEAGYLKTVINAKDGNKQAAVGRSIKQARVFARKSLASETEILKIEYALNSAGLEEDVARAGARISHMVAKATRGDPEQVAEIIATAYNNLGDSLSGTADEKMKQIGNILTKTQFQYQIRDFGQLGESMKVANSTAALYKISIDQTAAAVGFLNTKGFQGARGGTAFQAMMRSMTKAGDELGFSMVRGTDGSLDLMATLTELGASLDGMSIDEKADTIGKIFGDEGKGAVIAYVNDLETLKDGFVGVAKSAKSNFTEEQYADLAKLASGQLTMLTQSIGQVATVIGSKLLPVLTPVLNVGGKIMGALAWGLDNIPGIGLAIGVLATFVVAVGTAMAVTTTATWAWNVAMGVTANARIVGFVRLLSRGLLTLATRALPAVIVGTRALGAAMMANPIGFLVGAIAIGAVLIIKYWKPIKAFFGRVWTKIRVPVMRTWNLFKTVFKWSPLGLLTRGIGAGFKYVRNAIRSPGSVLNRMWRLFKTVFKWSPVGILMRTMGTGFKLLRSLIRSPRAVATKTWGLLKTIFSWTPLGLAKRGWDGLPKIYKGVMGKIVAIAKIAMDKVKGFILAPIKMVGKLWDKITGRRPVVKGGRVVISGGASNDNLVVAANENDNRKPKGPPPPPTPYIIRTTSQAAAQAAQAAQGDTVFNIHVAGVVDADNFVRQIKPALDQHAQEQREASLHD